ncbi:DUF333 domain-containing protein [Candidatus Dojkabacteria bacterium]|nr:DUF333 domain-containing protein [Candidatus Dojkabacteria bacterium]
MAAGNPVMESYPRQCSLNGKVFTEEIDNNEQSEQDQDDSNNENNGESEDMEIANPASVYCKENGGTLEIIYKGDGSYGVCVFDDGSECEEWAFYEGECEKGDTSDSADTYDWEAYQSKDIGISFEYPANIFKVTENDNKMSLIHTLENYKIESMKDGSKSPANDIVIRFLKEDTNGDCSRVKEAGVMGNMFEYTNIEGTVYYEGAEGQGVYYYCPSNLESNLIVERESLSGGGGLWTEESDYISADEQEKILDKVLNSLKFLE